MSKVLPLREAGPDDLPAILALARSCHGAPVWSDAMWSQVLQDSARATLVVEEAGNLAGFIVVNDIIVASEIETVAVRAASRGRGIGRALCRAAMAWSGTRGSQAMQLELRASNTAALALYARLGFLEQGRRKAYYRDPVEDAVLMTAPLS